MRLSHTNDRTDTGMTRLALALLLGTLAAGAHAATVYRCADGHGPLAFQDTPCATQAQQHELDVTPQPLIGASDGTAAQAARMRQAMSWECRAADGEVFYRHTHCPSSVPGDGVVRSRYAEKRASEHARGRHGAWSRVRVHGTRISRVEACRRIHAAGAAVRDGHLRDATVSTYDHLMGRDPCEGD